MTRITTAKRLRLPMRGLGEKPSAELVRLRLDNDRLREENTRLRAAMRALQTPVHEGESALEVHRNALIETFCAVVPEGDHRSFVLDCLAGGMVPSLANAHARKLAAEAKEELGAWYNFVTRLSWHLKLPNGTPHLDDVFEVARASAHFHQEEGALWMKEAVESIVSDGLSVKTDLDPAEVCAERREKERR